MIAVTGASGRTGAATAEALLKLGEKVRVVVRKAEQGEQWARRHCEVAIADFDDPPSLTKALKGLTGAYLMLPPPAGDDPLAAQAALLNKLVAAVQGAGLKRVLFLSAIGAQHPAGTGPTVALHRAEKALHHAAPSVTFLRAALFLENWAQWLLPALETGTIPFFGHTHLQFPQVGAHDVGVLAAQLLADGAHHGQRVVELAGQKNWSAEEIAEVVTSLLGQKVTAVERPVADARPALEKLGLSPALAALHAETYDALAHARLAFAHPHQVKRGATTLFDALKPLV
ncbi:MAG: NmrA family NAD(P)-binding protein [Myxococcaceae bacterium]